MMQDPTRLRFKPISVGETHGQWAVNLAEGGADVSDGASASFRMWHRDTLRVIVDDEPAVFVTPSRVEYTRQPSDVAYPGHYVGVFRITHTDGSASVSDEIDIAIQAVP